MTIIHSVQSQKTQTIQYGWWFKIKAFLKGLNPKIHFAYIKKMNFTIKSNSFTFNNKTRFCVDACL